MENERGYVMFTTKEANFNEGCFEGVNLTRANLNEGNFKRANRRGADLRKANLEGANLEDAHYLTFNQLSKMKTLHDTK
jgi:uncharacterized protein YjbI with pentapeptide repeats